MIHYHIRKIDPSEIESARRLQLNCLDKYHSAMVKEFPRYSESDLILFPNEDYFDSQYLLLGAFKNDEIIGTISVIIYDDYIRQTSEKANEEYWKAFTEEEDKQRNALINQLIITYINPPKGAYLIQDLCVHEMYRKNGVATRLILEVINSLDEEKRKKLYIEIERLRWHSHFLIKLKFECVKRTFSFKEKLIYNSWGSMLFTYKGDK